MNTKLLSIAAIALTALSFNAPALADRDDHDGWGRANHNWQGNDNYHGTDRHDNDRRDNDRWRDNGYHDNGWHGRKDYRNERVVVVNRSYVYGSPRPYQDWRRGQYLPTAYRGRTYYVNDWRSYNLYEPPRGHRWVRVNGDYVLVAVASNIIAQILLGR